MFGAGAGMAMGQLFDFVLAGVGMDEVGSACGVLQAVQQLASTSAGLTEQWSYTLALVTSTRRA